MSVDTARTGWREARTRRGIQLLAALCLAALAGCLSPSGTHPPQASDWAFQILETDHATVHSEPGVSQEDSREVGILFENGYRVVGGDLGYPAKRPQLYVYASEQRMYEDLLTRWGYPTWVREVHTVPRMHRDYIEWIPPGQHQDIAFITHEYSHRIIEQLAGLNSQINFKWLDEGLAEYEGQEALAQLFPAAAHSKAEARQRLLAGSSASGTLIPFFEMTTERQWDEQIQHGSQLAYPEAWAALDYLVGRYGMARVKGVLVLIGTGKRFPEAFREIYGFTVDQFEASFRTFLSATSM